MPLSSGALEEQTKKAWNEIAGYIMELYDSFDSIPEGNSHCLEARDTESWRCSLMQVGIIYTVVRGMDIVNIEVGLSKNQVSLVVLEKDLVKD